MLSTMKTGTKILVGFSIALLITCTVGVVGFMGVGSLDSAVTEIGEVRLPSVDSLLVIGQEAQAIRGSMRTLTIPGLPLEMRERQYQNLVASRERYEAAWQTYEPLPQSKEEAEVWGRLVPAWNAWRAENSKYIELSRRYDSLGIMNPYGLRARIEQYTKEHYILNQQVLHMLHMGENMQGGDDHTTCNFGRWLATYSTTNPALMTIMQEVREPHRRFHAAIGNIQRLVRQNDREAALQAYESELVPSMAETFKCFEAVLGVATQGQELLGEMQTADRERVTPAQREANALLARVVEINQNLATEEAHAAHATARSVNTAVVASIVIGALTMLGLGVFLSRAIGKTLRNLIGEATRLSEAAVDGKLDTRADVNIVSPEFQPIIKGVNDTLDAVVGPLNVAAEYVERISKGDIPEPITDTYKGDFNEIKNNLNQCIAAVDRLVADANMLSDAAVQGKLDTRADASKHQGDFAAIVQGVNRTLDAVLDPIKEASGVLERLSKYDLRSRVQGNYQGDHAKIKDSLNTTAEALHDALAQVADAVEQISSASTQIASSSQQVASGASQQASSLEETSASLEEMASMTKQNAGNTQQAKGLTDTTKTVGDKGSKAMTDMIDAMGRIRGAAENTAAIIKDINEIAFQTNLLALNAAVEAARAGDAGRGFAVVAEEVRNLAQRAKEAAKKTEELIKESVTLAENGASISQDVNGNLQEMVDSVGKVADIVAEINVASTEQSRGIEQVNNAVAEMDKVVQQAAANSEESSSAAQELAGQAQELESTVSRFQMNRRTARRPAKLAGSRSTRSTPSAPTKTPGGKIDPEEIVPLLNEVEELANF